MTRWTKKLLDAGCWCAGRLEFHKDESGTARWALDHLFLDQDAVPTLVEVKRSSDPRIRREVVAQMLDYAANAVRYFPVERLQALLEQRCKSATLNVDAEVKTLLKDEDGDVSAFWQKAKTNMQAGKIRMVFIADEIPHELRRIIEFLNEQMDPAEVLGVEVRQYVGSGLQTLVPRVIGQTAEAQQKKSAGIRDKRQWDETSFFPEITERRGEAEATVAKQILDWAQMLKLDVVWGQGTVDGSYTPKVQHKNEAHTLFSVFTAGYAQVAFGGMRALAVGDTDRRIELLNHLNTIPGVSLDKNKIDKWPSIPLTKLSNESSLQAFLAAMGWAIEQIHAS